MGIERASEGQDALWPPVLNASRRQTRQHLASASGGVIVFTVNQSQYIYEGQFVDLCLFFLFFFSSGALRGLVMAVVVNSGRAAVKGGGAGNTGARSTMYK